MGQKNNPWGAGVPCLTMPRLATAGLVFVILANFAGIVNHSPKMKIIFKNENNFQKWFVFFAGGLQ